MEGYKTDVGLRGEGSEGGVAKKWAGSKERGQKWEWSHILGRIFSLGRVFYLDAFLLWVVFLL
jgi:hypothetical protein